MTEDWDQWRSNQFGSSHGPHCDYMYAFKDLAVKDYLDIVKGYQKNKEPLPNAMLFQMISEIERLRATVQQQSDLIKQLKEMAHIPSD